MQRFDNETQTKHYAGSRAKKTGTGQRVTEESKANGLHLNEDWQCLADEYKIVELIGSGSFGSVYQAVHRQSGRTVAIKRIDDVFQH